MENFNLLCFDKNMFWLIIFLQSDLNLFKYFYILYVKISIFVILHLFTFNGNKEIFVCKQNRGLVRIGTGVLSTIGANYSTLNCL